MRRIIAMKKYVLAITLGIVALGLSSCRRDATTPAEVKEELRARTVVFTVAGRSYEVKSTDGGFDGGDIIGIIAPDLGYINVKGKVDGRALLPEVPIRWEAGQTRFSEFFAYYPYDEGLNSTTSKMSIPSDQSTEEAFLAADLRTAHVNAEPLTTVDFVLGHRFSRINFVLSSKVGGEAAEKVVLKDLLTEATVDLSTGGTALSGSKADISALKQGDNRFAAIVLPQPYMEVIVTTNKGRDIKYTTYTPVTLEGGCAYEARLVIPETGHSPSEIGFTLSIIDWENGGTVSYGEPKEEGL